METVKEYHSTTKTATESSQVETGTALRKTEDKPVVISSEEVSQLSGNAILGASTERNTNVEADKNVLSKYSSSQGQNECSSSTSSRARQTENQLQNHSWPTSTGNTLVLASNESSSPEVATESSETATAIHQKPIDTSLCLYRRSDLESVLAETRAINGEMDDDDDRFYSITVDDVRRMQLNLQKSTSNEGMLMTKRMKERERQNKMGAFQEVLIRFELPAPNAEYVLESTFRSSDLIQAVRNRLTEQLPYTEIELFTAPPKRVLQDDQTLYDLGFFTRGKIHISSPKAMEIPEAVVSSLLKIPKMPSPREKRPNSGGRPKRELHNTPPRNPNDNESSSSAGAQPQKKKVPKWFKTK